MTNHELEQQIRRAMEHAAPDRLDSILSSCDQGKSQGELIIMSEKKNRKKGKAGWIAAAAAAVLLIGFGVGLLRQKPEAPQAQVDAVILLDVNPSLSLSVDAEEKVLAAEALNEDAKEVLGSMELEGTSLEVAVNAIIGSMLQKGYLGDTQNSVLVSVENDDAARGEQLQQKVSAAVAGAMQSQSLEASVLTQTVSTGDAGLAELAGKYGISMGKAALIQEVIEQDSTMTFEELAPMTINEIALIASSRNGESSSVTQTGTASDKAYIGKEEALNLACAQAQIAAADALHIEVEFDSEDGRMVYEVEIKMETGEYEYEIDARTGEILRAESKNWRTEKEEHPTENVSASYIGENAALAVALNHAGVSESALTKMEIELDEHDNRMVYEVEFRTDHEKFEYEIDAVSGEIRKAERDD